MQAFCNVTRLPTSQTNQINCKHIQIIRIMDIMVTLRGLMRAEDGKLQSHLEWPNMIYIYIARHVRFCIAISNVMLSLLILAMYDNLMANELSCTGKFIQPLMHAEIIYRLV